MTRKATKRANTKPKAKAPIHIPDGYTGGTPRTDKLIGPPMDLQKFLAVISPPPGVVPKGVKLAMDELPNGLSAWAANSFYNLAFVEGWTFLGYPYLSQLAQIPEYRVMSETIAVEATRKWIEIQSTSDKAEKAKGGEGKSKSDKIKELDIELKRLGAREAFKLISEQDGFFGRSHLYLDTGATDDPAELQTALGDGGSVTRNKLKKGDLRALKTIEAVWCYPARYNASDPLKDAWYNPDTWFVNGKEVHKTRLLLFVGRPVPDLLKPAFSFGGLALSQMAKPYVDNWLQTRQSVNDLIQAFSTMVLKTDLSSLLMTGGAELDKRIAMFNAIRNNRGVMAVSKADEEFANVAVPLGTLDKLQAQAQEHMAAVSQIPLVKLLGIAPTGLNASSDGEIRCFYDRVHAYQEYFFRPHLTTVFKLAQINIWGQVDADLEFVFKPLWELDEAAMATVKKTEAETDCMLIDHSVLNPLESRQRIADDPDAPYGSIEVDDLPIATEPEEGNIHERIDEGEEGGESGGDESRAAA